MPKPTSARSGEAPEATALVKAKRGVIGSKVLTENGERVGEVRDYEFDPETFALTSLSVPPGMNVVGEIPMIAGDKVLTIGEDMIVVAADALRRDRRRRQKAETRRTLEPRPTQCFGATGHRGQDAPL